MSGSECKWGTRAGTRAVTTAAVPHLSHWWSSGAPRSVVRGVDHAPAAKSPAAALGPPQGRGGRACTYGLHRPEQNRARRGCDAPCFEGLRAAACCTRRCMLRGVRRGAHFDQAKGFFAEHERRPHVAARTQTNTQTRPEVGAHSPRHARRSAAAHRVPAMGSPSSGRFRRIWIWSGCVWRRRTAIHRASIFGWRSGTSSRCGGASCS